MNPYHSVSQLFFKLTFVFFALGSLTAQTPASSKAMGSSISKVSKPKKPTYLLIHGAWHPEECWDLVKQKLQKKGNTVKTVQLPGLGKDDTPLGQITLETHTYAVKKALSQIEGQVILVGHSYGGVVISQVAEDMPEKIHKLVYLTAFMLKSGESLADIALKDTLSVVTQNLIIEPPVAYIPKEKYVEAFYNSILTDHNKKVKQEVARIITMLKPHPIATIATPVSLSENYAKLPKVYITCLKDHAISAVAQKFMYSRFPETKLYVLDSDHSPFLTDVQKLVKILEKL